MRIKLIAVLCLFIVTLTVGLGGAAKPPKLTDATVINTSSNPVPMQNVGGGAATHLGQTGSHFVNLLCMKSLSENGCFNNVVAGGGLYSIPNGEDLVVTDVQFEGALPSPGPGEHGFLRLNVNGGIVASFSALSDSESFYCGQDHLTAGIVIPAGNTLTVSGGSSAGGINAQVTVWLQGYLIPTQ
jgi:hypothetical protein